MIKGRGGLYFTHYSTSAQLVSNRHYNSGVVFTVH